MPFFRRDHRASIGGAFNRQKVPCFFSSTPSRIDSPTALHVAKRKVRRRGKAGVGCGMCEGKVKVEGLKSINRKSPHPPRSHRRLGVITPCARSRETKGLDDKVQGQTALLRGGRARSRRGDWCYSILGFEIS